MVQKITKSIAFLLDLQTEQKQVTSHKMLLALTEFENEYPKALHFVILKRFSLSAQNYPVAEGLILSSLANVVDGQIQPRMA